MNKTMKRNTDTKLTVDIEGLAAMLSCGHATARKIGEQSNALLKVGGRNLYSVKKIEQYIESLTE